MKTWKTDHNSKIKSNIFVKVHLTKQQNGKLTLNSSYVPKISMSLKNKKDGKCGNKQWKTSKASNIKNEMKHEGRKRQSIVDLSEDSSCKLSKRVQYDPSEIMNKLEEFSDVWNDCPFVENPKQNYNHWFGGGDDKVIVNNDVEKGFIKATEQQTDKSHPRDRIYSDTSDQQMQKVKLDNLNTTNIRKENDSSAKTNIKTLTSQERKFNRPKINNSAEEFQTEPVKYDAKLADLKRRKAVQEQRQVHVDQKNIIKQALSFMDGKQKVNKKIVFSDATDLEIDEQQSNHTESEENKSTRCQKLFDDDDSETEVGLRLNHQFEGRKGQKLLELQSKFASDSRFSLDKRFYESSSGESEHEILESTANIGEKEKQLAILESVIQRQIKPLSETKRKFSKNLQETFLLRFDPSREDHSKYIIKPQGPKKQESIMESKKKKTKKAESERMNNVQENTTIVSSEKFVNVKEELKEVFNKEHRTEFSLLRLFDSSGTKVHDPDPELAKTTKKHSTRNSFKYNSSASQPDNEDDKEEELQSSQEKHKGFVKPASASWATTFFLAENDPRLQEGFEFLKAPEETEDNKEYAEKRKILKDFIRHKFKNNNRKKRPFKKKLGGIKRRVYHNKKGKHS